MIEFQAPPARVYVSLVSLALVPGIVGACVGALIAGLALQWIAQWMQGQPRLPRVDLREPAHRRALVISVVVAKLRPPYEICEQCHWPEKFHGRSLNEYVYFLPDEENTRHNLSMALHVGGGEPLQVLGNGMNSSIHWHVTAPSIAGLWQEMQTVRAVAGLSAVIGLLGICSTAGAEEKATEEKVAPWDASNLVSEKSCNLCHSKDKTGNQFGVWKKGPHANAVEVLATPKAVETAKAAGVKDPETSGKCLKCHATAYGFTEAKVTEDIAVKDGVTCQTCHGPTKEYKTKHSKDVAAAKENGLIEPTAKNMCLRCHNEQSPSYDPERYTIKDGKKVGFDFKQAAKKIAHPKPEQ